MNQQMRAYLDAPHERYGTHCEKWDRLEKYFGRADLIAMWVADMDFPTVPQVREALVERAMHPIYGYTDDAAAEKEAEVRWLLRRHDQKVEPEWILYSPGVVDSMFFCVEALTRPGDAVLVQPPVYGPFYSAVEAQGRKIVKNLLIHDESGWRMDFDDMEARFREGVRLMLLCNPHNPVGRVWDHEELSRLIELTRRYGVTVVCDEIHADFVLEGKIERILTFEDSGHCVQLASATKSFNLAGLRQSSMIVSDRTLREKIKAVRDRAHAGTSNIFGAIAQRVAYTCGDEWMDAVVEYVRENRDYAVDYIRRELGPIKCAPQQGTYLMWLDFNGLGMTHEAAMDLLVNRAGVAMNSGLFFGEEGRGWFRMNLATQRANVVKTLENIREAIRSR